MEEKKGASPAMPDAFEAGDRPTASEIQRQLIEQLQNTLVAARDANRATAAAREASAPRAGNLLLSAPLPTLEGRRYEPQGPDDPNDPENRALNPGTGVGAYAALLSRPQKEQLPPEQAIPQLFERMGAYKAHLTTILDACTEERTAAEVDEALAPVYERCVCAYSPIALRKMLLEAGALQCLAKEDNAPSNCREDNCEAPASEELENAAAADKPESPETEEDLANGSMYDQAGYLVIEKEDEGTWILTDAGAAYRESLDPEKEFHIELDRYADVEDVFYEVLAFCEQGRSITDIARYFENDSRLGPHTFYVTHVVDRLERTGALEWRKQWIATDLGRKLLNEKKER